MSPRVLWAISVPMALLAWGGLLFLTGSLPPSLIAYALFLPLLALAVTMTLSPFVWVIARALRAAGTGERPALAMRAAFWMGAWVAACAGLKLRGLFNPVQVLVLGAVMALFETFLLQSSQRNRQRR